MEGDQSKEETIKQTFDLLDKDRDGNIDVKELEKFISNQGLNIPQEDLQEMIERIDSNGDGKIQFSEYKQAMDKILTNEDETILCKQIFDALDRGSDKVISIEELKYAFYCLGEILTDDEVRGLISHASEDGQNVTYDDFERIYKEIMKETKEYDI
jgi:Ca2+-binding EF-hand superfamily protein